MPLPTEWRPGQAVWHYSYLNGGPGPLECRFQDSRFMDARAEALVVTAYGKEQWVDLECLYSTRDSALRGELRRERRDDWLATLEVLST